MSDPFDMSLPRQNDTPSKDDQHDYDIVGLENLTRRVLRFPVYYKAIRHIDEMETYGLKALPYLETIVSECINPAVKDSARHAIQQLRKKYG